MSRQAERPSNGIMIVALAIALVVLAAPIYIGAFESGAQKASRDVDRDVEKARRILVQVDENLAAVREMRLRLAAAGVDLNNDSPPPGGQPDAGAEGDAAQASVERMKRRIDMASRERGELVGDVAARRVSVTGPVAPRTAIQELKTKLDENDKLLAQAEATINAALGRGNSIWASRTAAMVGWLKGRIASDRAWLDRWQAGALFTDARTQLVGASGLEQMARAAAARAPTDAIKSATQRKVELDQQLAELQDQSKTDAARIASLENQVKELRAKAAQARKSMTELEAQGFKPADALKASDEVKAYRERYEALSAEARQAESQADGIEFGALQGGQLVESDDGDLLNARYEGAKETKGLVEEKARHAAVEAAIAAVSANLKRATEELNALSKTAENWDNQQASVDDEAKKGAAAADATLTRATELLDSAAGADDAARTAYGKAETSALAAVREAKTRANDAQQKQSEIAAEQPVERLKMVTDDKDTEAGSLVLAANIAMAAAENYLDAIEAAEQYAELMEALRGVEPSDAKVVDWRKAGQQKIADALKHLEAAKLLIERATYDNVLGQRLSGKSYSWQVTQLIAAAHLLGMHLAEGEAANDARAAARTALQEVVGNREDSPLVGQARDVLKSLE